MTSYLDDAGKLLREAAAFVKRMESRDTKSPQELAELTWLKMQLADRHMQLAAIEKGLNPPPLPAPVYVGERAP